MLTIMNRRINSIQLQSGAVLVISLIMLLLLTLIGTTGMSVTSLEEKMAGNLRDRNLAFQAAESALERGEAAAAAATPSITCPGGANPAGYYLPLDANCDGTKETTHIWDTAVWTDDTKSIPYNTDGNATTVDLTGLKENPRYIVEDMGTVCLDAGGALVTTLPCSSPNVSHHNYRITARATGGTTNSVVVLQSLRQIP
jgi:type IV pilus assembly protein PilX